MFAGGGWCGASSRSARVRRCSDLPALSENAFRIRGHPLFGVGVRVALRRSVVSAQREIMRARRQAPRKAIFAISATDPIIATGPDEFWRFRHVGDRKWEKVIHRAAIKVVRILVELRAGYASHQLPGALQFRLGRNVSRGSSWDKCRRGNRHAPSAAGGRCSPCQSASTRPP